MGTTDGLKENALLNLILGTVFDHIQRKKTREREDRSG
jgi:hypothetical protein